MKLALLVAVLAQVVISGHVGVRTTSPLSPAGVTYVDGSYHAGLAAGPLAYSASLSQPVFHAASATAPLAVPSQSVAAVPVAYSAPATKYAAVPTVEHVPGVADVPVTRIEAQPAVIQKTVDVARPAVKTQRYEVRRPAIQKEFYDIEERVVVRPAGSAVVELDEPLSRTQKGPSVIRPTGEAVAVSSAVPAISEVSAVSPAPADLPSVEINLARSSLGPASSVVSSAPFGSTGINYARSSFNVAAPSVSAVAPAPLPSSEINLARSSFVVSSGSPAPHSSAEVSLTRSSFAAPSIASPVPVPSTGVSLARSSFAAPSVAAVSPAPIPSAGVSLARSSFDAPSVSVSPAPLSSSGINYARSSINVATPVVSDVSSASVPLPTVGINIARSSFAPPVRTGAYFTGQPVGISAVPVKTVSAPISVAAPAPISIAAPTPVSVAAPAPIHSSPITGITSVSSGSSGISSGVSFSTPAPEYQQEIVQTTPAPQFSDDSVSIDSADFGLARSSLARQEFQARQSYQSAPFQTYAAAPAREAIFRREQPPRRFTGQPSAASRSSLVVNALELVPQHRFRAGSIYSETSQSSINHENQQKLLQLLTARGGVSEIGFRRSGSAHYPVDAGEVRARVLSATPAPAYSAPTDERVNTRRVVVSRPIETLQEVEVAEPVTKYERVQVDQPTLIKTARQEVVRVPTSVPVYGKALAPVADAQVSYSADWQ